jgi:hypothetical protein
VSRVFQDLCIAESVNTLLADLNQRHPSDRVCPAATNV